MYDQILGGSSGGGGVALFFTFCGVCIGVIILLIVWGICVVGGSSFKPFENDAILWFCIIVCGFFGFCIGSI